LMFSATFSKEIKKLAEGILRNPVSVEAEPQNSTAKKVTHKVFKVDKNKKTEFTIKLIKDGNWNQVLVFTRTKHGANKLTEKLIKAGISAAAIHGNKSQGARTKALKNFKDNSIKILVATDIAARGLDIPLLPHVINFELPNVPEDYIHRIGRTGRAGAAGEAISLVCSEETEYQNEIEKILKEKLKTNIVAGFEPTDTAAPKRAASQSKGSFGKKKNNSNSQGEKPKSKPHFKGNKPAGATSGRGRTGTPKKKRY
jgi:ATP-dependent RNA helicase RhlE